MVEKLEIDLGRVLELQQHIIYLSHELEKDQHMTVRVAEKFRHLRIVLDHLEGLIFTSRHNLQGNHRISFWLFKIKAFRILKIAERTIAYGRNVLEHITVTVRDYEERPFAYAAIAAGRGIPNIQDRGELRRWWHEILREFGRYSCCTILLILPSNKEAIRYLTEYGKELHIASGKDSLVIGISRTEIKSFGFDENLWSVTIQEQASEGYCIQIAELFEISISEFPCAVIFEDIRSSEHVIVSLKNMTAEEIAQQMRSVFAVVHKAVIDKERALEAINRQRNREAFRNSGNTIISELHNIADKTLETVIDAVIRANIK